MGTHSISAGLDYPGVGPEHAWLHETKRGEYISATDEQALRGFRACTQLEGIIPALETSHAVWGTMELAKTLPKDANIVMVRRSLPVSLPIVTPLTLNPRLRPYRPCLVVATRTSRKSATSSRKSGPTASTGVSLPLFRYTQNLLPRANILASRLQTSTPRRMTSSTRLARHSRQIALLCTDCSFLG